MGSTYFVAVHKMMPLCVTLQISVREQVRLTESQFEKAVSGVSAFDCTKIRRLKAGKMTVEQREIFLHIKMCMAATG